MNLRICYYFLLPALLASACIYQAPNVETKKHIPTIALVMKSLKNEYFAAMAASAKKFHSSEEHRFNLTVVGIENEQHVGAQIRLIEELVAQRVDAIIIAPADSEALVRPLHRATQAGIKVVAIDSELSAATLKEVGIKVPFIGPDNESSAKAVALALSQQLNKGAEVAIIGGIPTAENAQARKRGFEAAIRQSSLRLVASQDANWQADQAKRITQSLVLEYPRLRALFCANDNMALGALAAIQEAKLTGQIKIVGFDNIAAIQAHIESGRIFATAEQYGNDQAIYAIKYALGMVGGERLVEGETTPFKVIAFRGLEAKKTF